mgnify:CR=1 FL=1
MKIVVTLPGGETKIVNAVPGNTVMDTMRVARLPVRAECGGAMACATCHVVVDPEWVGKVGRPGDEESDLLEESIYKTDASRLACQIIIKDALDGLRVALQPDAFEE